MLIEVLIRDEMEEGMDAFKVKPRNQAGFVGKVQEGFRQGNVL